MVGATALGCFTEGRTSSHLAFKQASMAARSVGSADGRLAAGLGYTASLSESFAMLSFEI